MKIILRRGLAVIALAAAFTLVAAPAHAAAVVTAVAATAIAFTVDPLAVVQFLIAFVLPVLVGLVTTRDTSPAVKAWLLASLSLVNSLLIELARALTAAITYDLGVALLAALPAFVVSVASHYGLWKPTGVAGKAQDVGAKPSGIPTVLKDGERVIPADEIRRISEARRLEGE